MPVGGGLAGTMCRGVCKRRSGLAWLAGVMVVFAQPCPGWRNMRSDGWAGRLVNLAVGNKWTGRETRSLPKVSVLWVGVGWKARAPRQCLPIH